MLFKLCLEEIEGRWVACSRAGHSPAASSAPDWWGCFAAGDTPQAAAAAMPQALADYFLWLRERRLGLGDVRDDARPTEVLNAPGPPALDRVRVEVAEMQPAAFPSADYEANAFFDADRRRLSEADVRMARQLLRWTRAHLLAAAAGLATEELERPVEDEWSMHKILLHVGVAEWWYLDRLDLAFAREALPAEPFERLRRVRAEFEAKLPALRDDVRIVDPQGEGWSARKVIRRAIWHERDHTAHLLQFRARLSGGPAA